MTNGDKNGSDDGIINRRKFVASVSALGVAGAAGCSEDGSDGETPTEGSGTDSPAQGTDTTGATTVPADETPPATDETTPATTEPPQQPRFRPIPMDLEYKFANGNFSGMPNFSNLAGSSTGEPDVVTSESEDGAGAFQFEGALPIGDRLESGTYTFHADEDRVSTGRLVVYLDGQEVSFSGGQAEVDLDGTHDLRVEFIQENGDEQISLGWEGTHGELLPRIAETDPIRQDRQAETRYEVEVGTRPNSKRIQMPNSGSSESARSLAVGLPTFENFCFDPNNGGVQYAWLGAFLDYGPMVAYGSGRGDSPGQPLNDVFDVGGVEYPLRIGNPSAEPDVEFLGYRETPHPPELHYTVDGRNVTQTVTGLEDGVGLEYTFAFDGRTSQVVYFHTAADANVEREASTGSWEDGTLQITEQIDGFTVTLRNTEVGR